MEVVDEVTSRRWPGERAVITIGAYDGVHLGHQAVIAQVRRRAGELDAKSVVVTFDRHPASVVRPESAPALLTDVEQKLELLASTGIDAVVVVPFDSERASETASEFVRGVLVGALATRLVIVGEDFHFGRGRQGNVELLRHLGADFDFDVSPMTLVGGRGESVAPISSTAIRAAIRAGDLDAAIDGLGRRYEMRGLVGHGDERGRTIGFPTANIEVPAAMCLPADGVYAAWFLRDDGRRHRCAVNIGRRPTFYDAAETSLVEAHLLDFSGDLYGERVRVEFVRRLRPEQRFSGIDELVAQLTRDVELTRLTLSVGA